MTTPGRRALILTGGVAFLFAVILTFPAHVAARWLLPNDVRMSGIEGTLWRGKATAVAVGPLVAGPVEWRVKALGLLVGRLQVDLDLKLPGGALEGRAAVSPGGKVRLSAMTGVVPLAALQQLIPIDTFDGRIGLDIDSAVVANGRLVDARGTIDIVDLRMIAPVQEELGNYELAFDGAGEDSLDGVFRQTRAPLEAQGVLVLHAAGTWELNGTISTTPNTPARLSQGLAYLPRAEQPGRFLLSFSGEL